MTKWITKRKVTSFSTCATSRLEALDFENWFQDSSGGNCYIHVLSPRPDDTWHRVYPRKIRGKTVQRLAVYEGSIYWLYDDAAR